MVERAAACRHILATITLTVHHVATSVVEHVIRCFASSRSLVFLLKLFGHSFVFAVFCEMSYVLAAEGAIRHPLGFPLPLPSCPL